MGSLDAVKETPEKAIDAIPQGTGIIYAYTLPPSGADNQFLYVGQSINIKERKRKHMTVPKGGEVEAQPVYSASHGNRQPTGLCRAEYQRKGAKA